MSRKKVDWAKYHNRHSSKSIWVTRLLFCQNDSPIGESFWPKDSLITHTFWTMPIMPSLLFFWTHFMYIKKGFIYSKMPFHKFSTSETLNDDSIHKKKNSHTVVQLYDRKNLIPYSNIEHKLEDIWRQSKTCLKNSNTYI